MCCQQEQTACNRGVIETRAGAVVRGGLCGGLPRPNAGGGAAALPRALAPAPAAWGRVSVGDPSPVPCPASSSSPRAPWCAPGTHHAVHPRPSAIPVPRHLAAFSSTPSLYTGSSPRPSFGWWPCTPLCWHSQGATGIGVALTSTWVGDKWGESLSDQGASLSGSVVRARSAVRWGRRGGICTFSLCF